MGLPDNASKGNKRIPLHDGHRAIAGIIGQVRMEDLGPRSLPSAQTREAVEAALFDALNEIRPMEAREEALAIFKTKLIEIPGENGQGKVPHLHLGLDSTAWGCYLRMLEPEPLMLGHGQLGDELRELAVSMRKVAGRLNTLSPTAREWIGLFLSVGNIDESLRGMLWKWIECEASEAFVDHQEMLDGLNGPKLAVRLESMAQILLFLEDQARMAGRRSPGAHSAFAAQEADFGIMDACASTLQAWGKKLKHLRPIARAIYQWGRKSCGEKAIKPSKKWAKRQEDEAIVKYSVPATWEWLEYLR